MPVQAIYRVVGGTDQPTRALIATLSKLDGVRAVTVDAEAGRVTVTSARPLLLTDVAAAMASAGFQLASRADRDDRGSVLPVSTRDDTDLGWGERPANADGWLRDQRPPHWG